MKTVNNFLDGIFGQYIVQKSKTFHFFLTCLSLTLIAFISFYLLKIVGNDTFEFLEFFGSVLRWVIFFPILVPICALLVMGILAPITHIFVKFAKGAPGVGETFKVLSFNMFLSIALGVISISLIPRESEDVINKLLLLQMGSIAYGIISAVMYVISLYVTLRAYIYVKKTEPFLSFIFLYVTPIFIPMFLGIFNHT